MSDQSRRLARPLVLSAGLVALVAGHGIVLYQVLSRTGLAVAVVSGMMVLVVIKHIGLLCPLYVRFRRHFPRRR